MPSPADLKLCERVQDLLAADGREVARDAARRDAGSRMVVRDGRRDFAITVAPRPDNIDTPLGQALWTAGRTSKWLARQLGIDPGQVSRWLRGHSTPEYATQCRIAQLLEMDRSDIWGEQ